MYLYGKWKNLAPLTMASSATAAVNRAPSVSFTEPSRAAAGLSSSTEEGFEVVSRNGPTVSRPVNQWSAMTLERQKSEVLTTGIDGIQFVMNPKYSHKMQSSNACPFVIPHFDTMSYQQIDQKYPFSLDMERSIVNG